MFRLTVPRTAAGAQGEEPLAVGEGGLGNSAKWTFNFGRRVAWPLFGYIAIVLFEFFSLKRVQKIYGGVPKSGARSWWSGRSDCLIKTQQCDSVW